jgi:hypothetical protein
VNQEVETCLDKILAGVGSTAASPSSSDDIAALLLRRL